jgi:hypothetical protein
MPVIGCIANCTSLQVLSGLEATQVHVNSPSHVEKGYAFWKCQRKASQHIRCGGFFPPELERHANQFHQHSEVHPGHDASTPKFNCNYLEHGDTNTNTNTLIDRRP